VRRGTDRLDSGGLGSRIGADRRSAGAARLGGGNQRANEDPLRTIAVINRKGGCGKTTTTVSLAAALGEAGRRTLILDLDPQGSASSWLASGPTDRRELFDTFLGTRSLADLAIPTRAPGVDIVPSSSWLVTAERSLQVDLALGTIRAMERLPAAWDFVLVDCPPTLGYLASAALCGCREAILPLQPHGLDASGIEPVLEEIARVRQQLNPALVLTGIVVGRVSRTNHARDVVAWLRATHDGYVFETTIRDSIRVPEAAMAGLPVTAFAPDTAIAADIRAVAAELISRDPDAGAGAPIESDRGAGWRGVMSRLVGSRT
jgi:chromosome partitioning protein